MTATAEQRKAEHGKYDMAYKHSTYAMGPGRMKASHSLLKALDCRTSYLDVGCGRGEMLDYANELGFEYVEGVEVVDALINSRGDVNYGEAYALPYGAESFDVVTIFDVLEHILPSDTELVLEELNRVSAQYVILTAANYPSRSMGVELHVNRMAYSEWDDVIRSVFGSTVTWEPRVGGCNSEMWVVRK